MVGLQETRTRKQQLRTAEYHTCASGAGQGNGGLDTWVATPQFQLERWGRVVIHPGSMAVAPATPRLLITTHTMVWGRLRVVNGHAPPPRPRRRRSATASGGGGAAGKALARPRSRVAWGV